MRTKTMSTSYPRLLIALGVPGVLLLSIGLFWARLPMEMSSFALLTVVSCVVSFFRRGNALGGWLLFYLLEVCGNMAIAWIFLSAPLMRFDPAGWDNKALYLVFMTTTIPDLVALVSQVGLSVWLIWKRRQKGSRMINYLRLVLASDVVFSILALPVDILYWPRSVGWDIYSIGWPLIWLLYFTYSKRVRKVFVTGDWGSTQGREVPG